MSCTIKATYIYLSFYNISQSVLVLLNMAQSSTYTDWLFFLYLPLLVLIFSRTSVLYFIASSTFLGLIC